MIVSCGSAPVDSGCGGPGGDRQCQDRGAGGDPVLRRGSRPGAADGALHAPDGGRAAAGRPRRGQRPGAGGDLLPRADDECLLPCRRGRAGAVVRRRHQHERRHVRDARHEHGADDRVPCCGGSARTAAAWPARGGWRRSRWPGCKQVVAFADDALHAGLPSSPSRSGWTRRSASRSGRGMSSGTARAIPATCGARRSACPRGWCSWPARSRSFARRRGVEAAVAIARRHRGHPVRPGGGGPVLRPRTRPAGRPRPGLGLGRGPGRRAGALAPGRRRRAWTRSSRRWPTWST